MVAGVVFLRKVIKYAHSLYLYLYYNLVGFNSNVKYLDEKSSFIVSLTTYGERINLVDLVIKSILSQTCKPRGIYLWLSYRDFPCGHIPSKIKNLENYGVSIFFIDENIRSYKKIFYTYIEALQMHGVEYIVTADDDVYYPNDWLELFKIKCGESKSANKKIVYCYRAQSISFLSNTKVECYRKWELASGDLPSRKMLPTGVSGICYPIDSLIGLDEQVFLSICPSTDDIWLKFLTLKNGYDSSLVMKQSIHFPPVLKPFSLPKKGLEIENVLNDVNTISFNKCLEYFKLSKVDFL